MCISGKESGILQIQHKLFQTQYGWSRLALSYHLWHVQPRIVSTKSVTGSLYQNYVCSIKSLSLHVIWFLRVWFKRFFLPSTGFYKKIKGLQYWIWKKEGFRKNAPVAFLHVTSNKQFSQRKRKWQENIICMLLITVFYIISLIFLSKAFNVKMIKGSLRVSSTGFHQNN